MAPQQRLSVQRLGKNSLLPPLNDTAFSEQYRHYNSQNLPSSLRHEKNNFLRRTAMGQAETDSNPQRLQPVFPIELSSKPYPEA